MIAVIGGGLAGAGLVKILNEKKIDFHWYYDENNSASSISSGIIQPVSGRNYVLAWKYDQLLEFALNFYSLKGINYISKKDIIRTIYPPNNPDKLEEKLQILSNHIHRISKNKILISSSYQVKVQKFIAAIKSENFIMQNTFKKHFSYKDIVLNNNDVSLENKKYDQLIFAEGVQVKNNPWFSSLNFSANRGEALKVSIEDFSQDTIIHDKKTLCDFHNKKWIGSSFDRVELDSPLKTKKVYKELAAQLEVIIGHKNYSIEEHLAAFRTTTMDRKPIIGKHKDIQELYIFNGFGSKGTSLIPYFGDQLISNIMNGKAIDYQVSIDRFH